MRKAINQFKRTVRDIVFAAAFLTALVITYELSIIPTHFYYAAAGIVFVGLCLWRVVKGIFQSDKYVNEYGYVVLSKINELEHRYLAKQKLGRELKPNEIVHHINGKKADNKIRNLCVMDREKHEHFHSWLRTKRRADGRYPRYKEQYQVLVREYGGTLLTGFVSEKPQYKQERHQFVLNNHKKIDSSAVVKPKAVSSKTLFHLLRRERKRIADDRHVPVYVIFHNNTLSEMAETLADTEESMLRIKGVTPIKLKMYGASFIAVIKKFKSSKNQNSA